MMKKCAKCKETEEHDELLICRRCKSAFHDDSDVMIAFYLLIPFSFVYFFFKDHLAMEFVYTLWILSWFLLYPAWKLFQKWRNPIRSVIKEMGYSLPYSWLGALVFFVSAAGFLAVPNSEILSGNPYVGYEPSEFYFEIVELGCYFLAFLYLGFILLFHRGVFFTLDRHYARIMSKEYELLTDLEILAKCNGDQCRCYFKNEAFEVDKNTFDRVYELVGCTYFMDRNRIFYLEHTAGRHADQILPEADISSFVFISREDEQPYFAFAKDSHRVYSLQGRYSKTLDDLSPESVLVVKDRYITDGKIIYQGDDRIELDLDPETFEVLPHNYVRDRNGVYMISGSNQMKLDFADPESFEPVDYKTFKDKSGVYQIEHSQIRRMEPDEVLSYVDSCV
jgi:hypothetical protein|tara:strand:- start:352 stop:1530 length:1179 start_codon:yes stop_codon:yes gene_type:complete